MLNRAAQKACEGESLSHLLSWRDGELTWRFPLTEACCRVDSILLGVGDIVPCGMPVLALLARDFFVDQSTLTGESVACREMRPPRKVRDRLPHCLIWITWVVSSATNVVSGTGNWQ